MRLSLKCWFSRGRAGTGPALAGAVLALGCLALALWLAAYHPLAPFWAVGAVLACAAAAARWRGFWLVAVPAALPWLDFSPWTGWLVTSEFDLLLLAVFAGSYARLAWRPVASAESRAPAAVATIEGAPQRAAPAAAAPPDRPLTLLLVALALSGLIGLARGFIDAGGTGSGWFQGYADPLNTLRVGKSLWLGLLTVPLARAALLRDPGAAAARLACGMLLGLGVLAGSVLWERLAYPGLFDFDQVYRATGLFWEMHVGGGAIDGYLALAMPFAWWALATARRRWQRLGALVLAVLLVYACIATFSRNVYLAVALPALALALAAWLRPLQRGAAWAGPGRATSGKTGSQLPQQEHVADAAFIPVEHRDASARTRRPAGSHLGLSIWLALALLALALPNWGAGSFLLNRMEDTGRVFGARLAHWEHALALLRDDPAWLAGIGLGRFPTHYAAASRQSQFPLRIDWRALSDGQGASGAAVKLRAARGLDLPPTTFALTQRVPVVAGARYQVELRARATTPSIVVAAVCERQLLYDWGCQYTAIPVAPTQELWVHQVRLLRGAVFRAQPWYAPRLAMFSLAVLNAGAEVEITDVRLTARGPADLIANGNFAQQLAHWFPAAQYHFLPWHADSLYLETLIESGWIGLLLLGALLALALQRLWRSAGQPSGLPRFLAASLGGLMLAGLFGSVMDAPRVAFLFYLLALFACQLPPQREKLALRTPHPPDHAAA